MPRTIYRPISRRIFIALAIIASFILVAVCGTMRGTERISSVQTPDHIHMHQVYKGMPLTSEFTSTSQGLSGIRIATIRGSSSPSVHIIDSATEKEIPSSITLASDSIHLAFETQRQSYNKRFRIVIENTQEKEWRLLIPYESDPTKYPTSLVWQKEVRKQGSLGITQFEKPTQAVRLARHLALPHQRPLWIGLALLILCIWSRKNIHHYLSSLRARTRISRMWFVGIWAIIVILYYPATKLFFYSDDVPILARTAMMWQESPLLLFTPHQYQEADIRSAFGFDFWRPVSFAIYPLLLHLTIPPSAFLYYFLNIALFAGIGCFLFRIAYTLTQSKEVSFLTVSLWAASSSKLGVVYWWSSVQDILASFFAMGSLVLYLSWRETGKNRTLFMSVASYFLALCSKEYVIVLPIAIIGMEWILAIQEQSKFSWKKLATTIRPLLYAMAVFLIVNTIALGDPTLPQNTANTYLFTLTPSNIARNIVIYASSTVEARLWPAVPMLERTIDEWLELSRAKTAGPYYPSVIAILAGVLCIGISWKNRNIRSLLLFSGFWWLLFMGPILLLGNDWKLRWLMLATFGSGLAIAYILSVLLQKIPLALYALSLAVLGYGFLHARDPQLNRFYREQSGYTQYAHDELLRQEQTIQDEKRIVLVGITPEQHTSLNAYLFRIYAKNPHADIMYTDSLPEHTEPGDVVINMTGKNPYYPESEK